MYFGNIKCLIFFAVRNKLLFKIVHGCYEIYISDCHLPGVNKLFLKYITIFIHFRMSIMTIISITNVKQDITFLYEKNNMPY